mgnify:CR=1 FL=1
MSMVCNGNLNTMLSRIGDEIEKRAALLKDSPFVSYDIKLNLISCFSAYRKRWLLH